MEYAELPIPASLSAMVAAIWTIDLGGDPAAWVAQDATPDGCIELIRRLRGRSAWDGDQPEIFATGLNLSPIRFAMSGDARFLGVRLWPWAWKQLSRVPPRDFIGRWIAVDTAGPIAALLDEPDEIVDRLGRMLDEEEPLAAAVLNARTAGDIVSASGRPHRAIQRWFEANVGMPPRQYLRLLRFRRTMTGLAEPAASLADRAARGGFADQAHMARDFRQLAGTRPSTAHARASGPFLPGDP
jgi:AraC-like DNA-binding protein